MEVRRRFPMGAEVQFGGGVHFRVWAPAAELVEVVFAGGETERLDRELGGYHGAYVLNAKPGTCYRFKLDSREMLYPDPASRFQPEGPHGWSEVIDASGFQWMDAGWPGIGPRGQVIYEMHIGTFTREGTWDGAERQLLHLAELGVTALELMPVADFPGSFGWGYDGVNLFAPTRLYGRPEDFRRFVDRAHALGMGVILDVVYNHFGPDGNYLKSFSPDYFTDRYKNDWGEPINFDGPNSGPVREFIISNAGYWIEDFHLDGLRLDATQQIFDVSPVNVMAEIVVEVRARARGRATYIVGENEPQHMALVRPKSKGGMGLDALWNDDFHHSAMVALTGRQDAYYTDYWGRPQEFLSAIKWGCLFQGQRYKWQKQRRGTPALDLSPEAFVLYIQNHDQIANSAKGERCHALTSPGRYRAMTALLLLAPGTPMLFQGQEFAASTPFLYFADHQPELARKVAEGRKEFLMQFRNMKLSEVHSRLPLPHEVRTFEACKLNFREREEHRSVLRLHCDLIRLRKRDRRFREQTARGVDGAVLGNQAFVLRYFSDQGDDRLMLVNFGRDIHLDPAPEPLLAPPEGKRWALLWSSEDVAYGGSGTPPIETEENWWIPGEATVIMVPEEDCDGTNRAA